MSTDGGKRWKDAVIQGTAARIAHTRFTYQWNWDGNETELLSRCTDELGQVQPTRAQVAAHFKVPLDPSSTVPGLDNTISALKDEVSSVRRPVALADTPPVDGQPADARQKVALLVSGRCL